MKISKKLLSLVVLFLLVIGLGTSIYAYWNILTQNKDINLPIGEATELKVSLADYIPTGKTLVPTGEVLWTNTQTDIITITYDVNLDGYTSEQDLVLNVAAQNVLIGNDATYANLIDINFAYDININSAIEQVTVTITLIEPTNITEYDAIKNQNITFTLVFSVSVG